MSLSLELGSKPHGLSVKTFGYPKMVIFVGGYEISLEDFLIMAHYVLTNCDLAEDDQRLQFLESIRAMRKVDGYNKGLKRLFTDVECIKAQEHLQRYLGEKNNK